MIDYENDVTSIDAEDVLTFEEIYEDVKADYSEVKILSREWTVETIYSQIKQGNIDLNPKFQRRSVWQDSKRSKLIESILLNVPIPEIILAERGNKTYVVIDGKQRLQTIAGFINPEQFPIWKSAKIKGKNIHESFVGKTHSDIISNNELNRSFYNAPIRCAVVFNFNSDDILYDIFYRVNTGAVPLSPQELRQVLHPGPFSDFLIDVTNELIPLQEAMKLDKPDIRLRDAELLLRYITISLFPQDYKGNLKAFLDDKLGFVNQHWAEYEARVKNIFHHFNSALTELGKRLGSIHYVGRKANLTNGNVRFESRFNKVLMEVEAYFFEQIVKRNIPSSPSHMDELRREIAQLCQNPEFVSAIGDTTKGLKEYQTRFVMMEESISRIFQIQLENPFRR